MTIRITKAYTTSVGVAGDESVFKGGFRAAFPGLSRLATRLPVRVASAGSGFAWRATLPEGTALRQGSDMLR